MKFYLSFRSKMANLKPFVSCFILFLIFDTCKGQACDSVLTGSGVIKSEGHPGTYPSNFDCEWTIEANDYDTVDLRFIDFNIEPGETCEFDSLEISAMGRAKKFCGDKLSNVGDNGRLTLRGTVVLRMRSDESVNLRGISLEYQVTRGVPPPTTPPPTTTPPPQGTTCDDEPCQNGADCAMLSDTEFICFCPDGYEGPLCGINIDDCASNPCENGGTCVDGIEEWSCECEPGYIGKTCGIDYDECRSSPCMNGGTCEDLLDSFSCTCVDGWTGTYCSTDFDDCSPNPCQNYGVCEDHLGYHSCICHPDYTGSNCEIRVAPRRTTTPMATATTPITVTTTTITLTTITSRRKTTAMPLAVHVGQPDIPAGLRGYLESPNKVSTVPVNPSINTPASNLGNGISTIDIEASTAQSTVLTSNPVRSTTSQPFRQQTNATEASASNLNFSVSVEQNSTTVAPHSDEFGRKLGTILGVILGACFMGIIAVSFYCNYASALKAEQVAPNTQKPASQDRKSSQAHILSPSSTDSGIAPDSEGQMLSSQNRMDQDNNTNTTVVSHSSTLFSPRPSPVNSPGYLPKLRELKIIEEERNGSFKLLSSDMYPSTFQHLTPKATVFTFSSQGSQHEPKSKRRRKIAQRSRSVRPKTAAPNVASQFCLSFPSSRKNMQKIHPFAADNTCRNSVASESSSLFQHTGILKSNTARPVTSGGNFKGLTSDLFNTNKPYHKNVSSNKTGTVNFNDPPLFLSELNKKPTFQFSKIDRSSAINNHISSNAWPCTDSCSEQAAKEGPTPRQPGNFGGENKQKTSVLTSPTDYLPAHSIEEAFESRNPRAFEVHHRRRLAPLNLNNNQRQNKTNSNQLQ